MNPPRQIPKIRIMVIRASIVIFIQRKLFSDELVKYYENTKSGGPLEEHSPDRCL